MLAVPFEKWVDAGSLSGVGSCCRGSVPAKLTGKDLMTWAGQINRRP